MSKILTHSQICTTTSNIKYALSGKRFIISIVGVVLTIVLSSLEDIIRTIRNTGLLLNGYHVQLVFDALSSDAFTLALPILSALPFTTAFVDDIKSGYIKLYLNRCDVASYIKSKLIACTLSGGLVLFIGIIISYGLSTLIFTPMELALTDGEAASPYLAQLLTVAATLFFSGAFFNYLRLFRL